MVQSPVASMMTTHSFLSSHAADRRFSAPDGSQLFGQGGGGSGNAVHSSFSNNFGIGFGGFNGAGSNGGMVDYKKQPYQQQQSSYYQQDPLTRRPRKQRSATENSKAFMQSGWDNAGFFPGFSNTTMNATAPTGSTSFDGNTGPSTSSILRHDEFGPYHQHYPQQQSSSSQYYSSSPQQFQQHQQQQQHQALLAMPIGSEQDNRLQELYQGVYHNRALADPTHSVLMEHQQQKAAEAAAAAAAAAAATVSGFADSSTPSQQQQQNAPYSFHDSVESMTASLSIGHPRDTSSSSTSSMMDRDASAAGWVSHQHPQHQHHYQTQHQQQHAYHPHMYSSYQTYSTDTGYPSQSGGTGMNAFPSSPSLDQQSQQPQVEEVWKAGMDRLGEYPFPEMTGHAASLFGSTAGHNNKHRKTARDAGIRLDIPPPAPVTNSLMTTVAAATAAAAANGAGPMESADGLGPATA
ncbi:hypothetical protein BGZ73_005514 [Actinomortierella ambigua]|nr:hypothetical protein BGZ73_005514 [Actinomortierella ambigua]